MYSKKILLCFSLNRNKSAIADVVDKESTQEERLNHFVSKDVLHTDIVMRALQMGVGERVEQLVYQLPSREEWSVDQTPPKPQHRLVIGIRLNRETAYSIVEKGPPANEPLVGTERLIRFFGSLRLIINRYE